MMTRNFKPLLALALSLQIGVMVPQALAAAAATGGNTVSVAAAEHPLTPEEWEAFQDFARQRNVPMLDEEEFARFCREKPDACILANIQNNNEYAGQRGLDHSKPKLWVSVFAAIYGIFFLGMLYSFLTWRRDGGQFRWEGSDSGTQVSSTSTSTGLPVANAGDMVIRVPRSSLSVNSGGTYSGNQLGLPNELSRLLGSNRVTVVMPGNISSSVVSESGLALDTYIDAGEDDALIIVPQNSFRPEDVPIWTQAAKSAVAQESGQALGGSVVVIPQTN